MWRRCHRECSRPVSFQTPHVAVCLNLVHNEADDEFLLLGKKKTAAFLLVCNNFRLLFKIWFFSQGWKLGLSRHFSTLRCVFISTSRQERALVSDISAGNLGCPALPDIQSRWTPPPAPDPERHRFLAPPVDKHWNDGGFTASSSKVRMAPHSRGKFWQGSGSPSNVLWWSVTHGLLRWGEPHRGNSYHKQMPKMCIFPIVPPCVPLLIETVKWKKGYLTG